MDFFTESISEEEHFAFYLARYRNILPLEYLPKTWLFPSEQRSTMERFQEYSGSPLDVIRRHTHLPLFGRFLERDDLDKLESHVLDESQLGIATMVGMGGPLSEWSKSLATRCEECIRVDLSFNGIPFWRRANLTPGVLFCSLHGRPLSHSCVACSGMASYSGRGIVLSHAGNHCGCGFRFVEGSIGLSKEAKAGEIEIAADLAELIDGTKHPNINQRAMRHTIRRVARENGWPTSNRAANEVIATIAKGNKRYEAVIKRSNFLARMANQAGGVFDGTRCLRHPLHNVLMLRVLGVSLNEVRVDDMNHTPTTLVQLPEDIATTYCPEKKRKWVQKYMISLVNRYVKERAKNPKSNHEDIVAHFAPSARLRITASRLIEHGVDVDLAADIRDCASRKQYAKGVNKSIENDVELRDRVIKTANYFIEIGYGKRIGLSLLLNQHPRGRFQRKIKKDYPLTRAALDKYTETAEDFKKRMLEASSHKTGGEGEHD